MSPRDFPELQPRCYFTCTLGEAEISNSTLPPAPYDTINEFLDYLAREFRDDIAVGCARPQCQESNSFSDGWIVEALTFGELQNLSQALAGHLSGYLDRDHGQGTVALFASSSLAYLIHFFAWLRLGHKVALISTACKGNAVRHLLEACGATAICYDFKHAKVVKEALVGETACSKSSVVQIQLERTSLDDIRQLKTSPNAVSIPIAAQQASAIVLYGHSSGTSTGLPKPIPITHQDEIGALPRYHQVTDHQRPESTFSTTPIYTGGLADLWRSWSAGTALWTYAENEVPVTAENILRYKSAVETWIADHQGNASSIGFVSCVPFVTQFMAEQPELLKWLQSMKMVGVGGAAMPAALGDILVRTGVSLVSRFGSRECGFLLSSNRDYSTDKEWQYLRHNPNVTSIVFKDWNGTDYELLVEKTWPSLSPAIRSKLPFNSHDVFTPHSSIRHAWKYNGRSDVQITLTTGKKFDPAGIEAALGASEWIKDAVVVGNDRSIPAAVIFTSPQAEALNADEQRSKILEMVIEVNSSCPTHARLMKNMVVVLSCDKASRIQKSSKGTVMRGKFAEDFADVIQELYSEPQKQTAGPMLDNLNEQELMQEISTIVKAESGIEFGKTSPGFYEAGIDSTISLQIRNQIRARLPDDLRGKVPLNVVYNTGNVQALVTLVRDLKSHSAADNAHENEIDTGKRKVEIDRFLDRIRNENKRKYQGFTTTIPQINHDNIEYPPPTGRAVLITGATGFLGAHVLVELANNERTEKIICLIRRNPKQSLQNEARSRVKEALLLYGLEISKDNETKVTYIYSSLEKPNLGLDSDFLQQHLPQITHFVHAAWAVNFSLPLEAFDAQLHGLLNLYNLATRNTSQGKLANFVFVSSTASTLQAVPPVPEKLSHDHEDCSSSGYGKSKWVAETLLAELAHQNPQPEISILRVGQLTANSKTGAWNMREAWPLMLDAGFNLIPHQNGKIVLPDLSDVADNELDWLPVDLAAKALLDLALGDHGQDVSDCPAVFHVLHNSASIQTWAEVKNWLSEPVMITSQHGTEEAQIEFIPPTLWLDLLEAEAETGKGHPAQSLISLWRDGWRPAANLRMSQKFSTLQANSKSRTMKQLSSSDGGINKEAFLKMLHWLLLNSRASHSSEV